MSSAGGAANDASFRCAAAREERDDPVGGTAPHVRAWLLVEHPGPWGIEAFRDARMPEGVGPAIKAAAARHGVRPLLIRRPGGATSDGIRVLTAVTRNAGTALASGLLGAYDDVLDLDLEALGAGDSAGLDPRPGAVYLVCTHGRHDVCCAERGRPVAAAAAATAPEETWECSHLGGDRFAANLLALPAGLYYGGLGPERTAELIGADREGRVTLDLLRGRCSLPPGGQAAEIALRRRLGLDVLADVTAVRLRREGAETAVRFRTPQGDWRVRVASGRGEPALLTCRAARESPTPRHDVLAIEPVDRPPAGE